MTDKIYRSTIFLFRRDLRLEDNSGLLRALEESAAVVPLFILDPQQIDTSRNEYFSRNAFQFMLESLVELDGALTNRRARLYLGEGEACDVLKDLLTTGAYDAVYFNQDFTPFSGKRDRAIRSLCDDQQVDCVVAHDALLAQPEDIQTGDGKPYKVYTAFMKKARQLCPVEEPRANKFYNFHDDAIEGLVTIERVESLLSTGERRDLAQRGGRRRALARMRAFDFSQYADRRDQPAVDGTSKLSAHLKFGTISVRELYWHVVNDIGAARARTYTNELYWRDFYAHLLYWYPEILTTAMRKKYRTKSGGSRIEWSRSKTVFEKWCAGRTGFPIVDAGMRQLNDTGWMHNRVRMIVGSFLVKDLHINWRWGEKYFARTLVDYDPASNNGGWQWVASTGADAQPYFRIFNPWSQQRRHDPECRYIKRYLPELQDLSPRQIHGIETGGVPEAVDYPAAIVDHSRERAVALDRYKDL